MQARTDYTTAGPGPHAAMRALGTYVHQNGLEVRLLERVRTRVSQINGCAYCIDMHTQMARVAGETEQRLYALSAWQETPFFTERERAALAWGEALTRVRRIGPRRPVRSRPRAFRGQGARRPLARNCRDQPLEPDGDRVRDTPRKLPACAQRVTRPGPGRIARSIEPAGDSPCPSSRCANF